MVDMEDEILLTYEEDALLEDNVMVTETMVAIAAEVEQGIASPAVSSASPSPAHSRQHSEAPSAR